MKKLSAKSIDRSILALAIPAIIANITTPLLGLVDMAIVGHMGEAVFIAAIALGGAIFSMIYWVFAFLRMGTSGLTAQGVGADDDRAVSAVFYRAMTIAVTLGLLLIAFQMPLCRGALWFMGGDDGTSSVTAGYFKILIYGAPATLGMYVLNGWFVGRQRSTVVMWLSLVINIVNIVGSLVFVYVLNMGVAGVAAGTLTAQWTGFIIGLLVASRYRFTAMRVAEIFRPEAMRRFMSVNLDIFLRTLCLVAVTVWFTRAGARQSDVVLSVNALLMQLFILFSYMMDGYAYAGEALVGKSTGAADGLQTSRTVRTLFRHGIMIAVTFTVIYAIGGEAILSILSDNAEVLSASAEYRWWAVAIPLAGFGAFIWDGVFIGSTLTRGMLISMAMATAAFFAVYFILFPLWNNHALWLAFIVYLSGRGAIQTLLYCRVLKV